MKVRKLLLIVGTVLLLCTTAFAGDYSDVPDNHWASGQIVYLSDEITGYPDGTFRPDKTVSRAEFITLLARTAFPDDLKNETGDTWWKPAFHACEKNNLLSGYDDPEEPMQRLEIAMMLGYFCRDWGGVNARADAAEQFVINWNEQRMESPAWGTLFSDTHGMDEDRYRACANQGLMMGYPDGTFQPENSVTRAEAAAILARLKAQLTLRKDGGQYVCTVGSNWLITQSNRSEAV